MTAAQAFDLTARQRPSRVLAGWLAANPGAAERAGLAPQASGAAPSWGGVSWDEWVRGNVGVGAVTEHTARAVAAVTACVNLIAGSVASLPLHLYRRSADGEREAYKDNLWWLLNERPGGAWSAAAMWEHVIASRLFYGDAYVRIHRGRSDTTADLPAAFEPLHPGRVTARRVGSMLVYTVAPDPILIGEAGTGDPPPAAHRPCARG